MTSLISDDKRKISVTIGTLLYVFGSSERHFEFTEEMHHRRDVSQKRCITEEMRHRRDVSQKRCVTEEMCHRRDVSQKRYIAEEMYHRRDVSQKRCTSLGDRYERETLFVVDVSIDWVTNRNWHTKVLDTWKVIQLDLLRQKSVENWHSSGCRARRLVV